LHFQSLIIDLPTVVQGLRIAGPFSPYLPSIRLAESAPLPHPVSGPPQSWMADGAAQWYDRSRLNYTDKRRFEWRRHRWSSVRYCCSAGPSDQGHFPNDFQTATYDHVRSRAYFAASRKQHRRWPAKPPMLTLKLAFCGCWNLMSLQHRPRSTSVGRLWTSQQ